MLALLLLLGIILESKIDSVVIYSDRVMVSRVASVYVEIICKIIDQVPVSQDPDI